MKKIIIIILLFSSCVQREREPTQRDWILMLLAIYFNVEDICVREYGVVSTLISQYQRDIFSQFSETCDNVIIGNSSMDLGRRVTGFFDPTRTHNYAIGGNTACDMLLQLKYIRCNPRNVIIGTADGNGVLRGISPEISANTIQKILNRIQERWNSRTVLIGIHPVNIQDANIRKNEVNSRVQNMPNCFIDMVELFGVGVNDLPPSEFMHDQVHYREAIYMKLKDRILSRCGVSL